MRNYCSIGLILILTVNSFGQTCQQEEITVRYTDGFEVFNICKSNPSIIFDEDKEYYWYTEFSKVKSTKGGCGGNLLHGNYKLYDEYGNLSADINYSFGLKDGNTVYWDVEGNITTKITFRKGEMLYWKFLNEEDLWIEYNGPPFQEGTIKKVYSKYGTLLSEDRTLPGLKTHVRVYYEYPSNQLKEEYITTGLGHNFPRGGYKAFHDNGRIKIEGQFFDGDYTNIRVGVWKWFDREGNMEGELKFKAEVSYWPNGKLKVAGGFIYSSDTNEWLKMGEWKWYNEEGKLQETKEYKGGIETTY